MLEHVLTDFLHYVKMARSHSVKTEHRAQESVKEHKRILEAIRQRDGDLAEQLANEQYSACNRKPGSALKDNNKICKREKPEISNGSKDKKQNKIRE